MKKAFQASHNCGWENPSFQTHEHSVIAPNLSYEFETCRYFQIGIDILIISNEETDVTLEIEASNMWSKICTDREITGGLNESWLISWITKYVHLLRVAISNQSGTVDFCQTLAVTGTSG